MLQNIDGIDIQEEIKKCERNIEIVQKNIKEFDEVCAEYFKIKQENNKALTELANLKKRLDSYENMEIPLKDFYSSLGTDIQLSIYNSNNELIKNENNVQICEDVVNKYANTTAYEVYDYGEYMDIVLDV